MARSDTVSAPTVGQRPAVELAAFAVGATFLLVGVLGFVPGVTQNLDTIEFAGRESEAELLGVFQVSILHNIVHLLFGVAGLVAAKSATVARNFLIFGGAIYAGLGAYGMAVDRMSDANFVPVNAADDWLHLGLGGAMMLLGIVLAPYARKS